jgi:hypothetical protein
MKNLDIIAKELFNKIRGRFPKVEIGDKDGTVINSPESARYFDFGFDTDVGVIGKVSISLDEENGITVIIGKDIVENQPQEVQTNWYNFLKELRVFSKKRLLNFDVRDINRSNLKKRDYKFLATNRPGDENMNESKLYGTNKTSFLNVGEARLRIKHSAPINPDIPSGRTQHVESIYIESPEGERFKYPYKHLSGAKAMARHVSEGGKPYDEFGTHIVGLSEELSNLKTFKRYMGRGGVMAESLSQYMDIVNERILDVKKTIDRLQKQNYYGEAVLNFEATMLEEVPNDVVENWVDQLTIKQFNEELKDVFPYIYKLVGEATRAKELDPEDVVAEADDPCWKNYKMVGTKKKGGKTVPNCVPEEIQLEQGFEQMMGQFADLPIVEKDIESGTLHVKFRMKRSLERDEKGNYKKYLVAFAGFATDPKEVTYNNSLRQYNDLKTRDSIANAVKSMVTDKVFLAAKEIVLYVKESTLSTSSSLRNFIKWMNDTYSGNKIKIEIEAGDDSDEEDIDSNIASVSVRLAGYDNDVDIGVGSIRIVKKFPLDIGSHVEVTSGEHSGHRGIVTGIKERTPKKRTPYGHVPDREIKKHEPKMTRYFTIGNTRLFNYLRREQMELMQKYFRPSQGGFVMDDKAFKSFMSLVTQLKDQFGDPQINIDQNRSFAETDVPPMDSNLPEKPKTPLGEFILSYFDKETGKFPKGETAVLTAVEKDYGRQYIKPAAEFIKRVESTTLEYKTKEAMNSPYPQIELMKNLAGI